MPGWRGLLHGGDNESDGKRGEVCELGEIANTPAALTKLLGKLGGPGVELHICYEAGPCGYGIQRQVTAAGHSCAVVAPSLIPRRPGDRIRTDRRDAVKLARLHRAGELTPVWVPDRAHEAMRDLVRARLAAVRSLRHARTPRKLPTILSADEVVRFLEAVPSLKARPR